MIYVLTLLLAVTPLAEMSPQAVDAFLAAQPPALTWTKRVHTVAEAALATPYKDGPLGEGPSGRFDQDPLIDLSRVDCVTYVEQVLALAASESYDEAFSRLQAIRYREGTIDFSTRHHFFISDWIAHNGFCRDISSGLGVETQPLTRTIGRKKFFDKATSGELGAGIKDQVESIRYVPLSHGATAEQKLPEAALLVFVGKIDWLFALHCGLYLKDEAGGMLYHASSKSGKVVKVALADYLRENAGRYLGFTAYSVAQPGKG